MNAGLQDTTFRECRHHDVCTLPLATTRIRHPIAARRDLPAISPCTDPRYPLHRTVALVGVHAPACRVSTTKLAYGTDGMNGSRNRLAALGILCFAGCASPKDSATDSESDTAVDESPTPNTTERCEPDVKVDGVLVEEMPAPRVGDSWYVRMYCNGTLQLGTYTLQVDPPDRATVDAEEPVLTFNSEGDATVTYRVGSDSATFSLTVSAR